MAAPSITLPQRQSGWSAYRFYWIALGVILLDQTVKLAVKFSMSPGQEFHVLGPYFKIHYVENPGAAFGVTLSDIFASIGVPLTNETAKILLTLFSIGAVIGIIYLLKRVWNYPTRLPFFIALILGGALGNIIDRVFYGVWFAGMNAYPGGLLHGKVVDMFFIDFSSASYSAGDGGFVPILPVFNIADIAITVGILAILIFHRRLFRDPRQGPTPPTGRPMGPLAAPAYRQAEPPQSGEPQGEDVQPREEEE